MNMHGLYGQRKYSDNQQPDDNLEPQKIFSSDIHAHQYNLKTPMLGVRRAKVVFSRSGRIWGSSAAAFIVLTGAREAVC